VLTMITRRACLYCLNAFGGLPLTAELVHGGDHHGLYA
jgi:hypothetical protein